MGQECGRIKGFVSQAMFLEVTLTVYNRDGQEEMYGTWLCTELLWKQQLGLMLQGKML